MNYYQTLTDVGSVNEQGQTVLCRMTKAVALITHSEPFLDPKGDVQKILDYQDLLIRPVTLGDLVPTNEKGEVLEKPEGYADGRSNADIEARLFEYEAAEKRVIFGEWTMHRTAKDGTIVLSGPKSNKLFFFIDGTVSINIYSPDSKSIKTLEDFPNNGIELILKKR